MLRYMRKKYDDFGERMWLGEIDVVDDDMDPHDFLDFEDPGWQYDWMKRQLRLMADFVESHAEGQAEIEMINYDGDLRDIRKHLYKQFGSGSGSNIHEKELEYDRGMAEKGKVAFPLLSRIKACPNCPDNHDRSFSDDWLPSWKMLKAALSP